MQSSSQSTFLFLQDIFKDCGSAGWNPPRYCRWGDMPSGQPSGPQPSDLPSGEPAGPPKWVVLLPAQSKAPPEEAVPTSVFFASSAGPSGPPPIAAPLPSGPPPPPAGPSTASPAASSCQDIRQNVPRFTYTTSAKPSMVPTQPSGPPPASVLTAALPPRPSRPVPTTEEPTAQGTSAGPRVAKSKRAGSVTFARGSVGSTAREEASAQRQKTSSTRPSRRGTSPYNKVVVKVESSSDEEVQQRELSVVPVDWPLDPEDDMPDPAAAVPSGPESKPMPSRSPA